MGDDARRQLDDTISIALDAFRAIPTTGLGAYLRVQAGLIATVALENVCANFDEDPYPRLLHMLSVVAKLPEAVSETIAHLNLNGGNRRGMETQQGRTAELFETAWTTYDDTTYDHSLSLIDERLRRSGFGESYFKGKNCFDGGCGTGRFSISMARSGANRVVAVDIGRDSLSYLRKVCSRYKVDNIELVEQDVTNLSPFPSDTFDFVASHGVLHHTGSPDRGIQEHFRITRPNGTFWLYLYGAGGLYWDAYDRLRQLVSAIEPRAVREILTQFAVRRGLIYTFLDNMQAPRVYYRLEQVLDLLRPHGHFKYVNMQGSSSIDDTAKLLSTRYGREIFGPDGEIRLVITKLTSSVAK